MNVEELRVQFTANIKDFKEKTAQVNKDLKSVSEISDKCKSELSKAMKKPTEETVKLSNELDKLRLNFTKEKNAIAQAQEKIELYDSQMQQLAKTHKEQLAEADKARQKVGELTSAYSHVKSLLSSFGTNIPLTAQLKTAEEETNALREKIDSLKEEMNKPASKNTGVMYGKVVLSKDEAQKELDSLTAKLKESVANEKDLKYTIKVAGDKPEQTLKQLQKEIDGASAEYEKLKGKASNTYDEMSSLAAKTAAETRKIDLSQIKLEALGPKAKILLKTVKTTIGVFSELKSVGKTVGNGLKTAFTSVAEKIKSTHSHTSSLSSSFKKFITVAGGLSLVKGIFGTLKNTVSEYINSNEQLQNRVSNLKNAFGQALAPAINVVVSVFDKLMPYILAVTNYIGELLNKLSALAGLKTTATALSSVASATNEVADAQNQLYGFDKITKESDNSSSSSSSSSSSGGVNYEVASVPWLDKIKQSIEAGDWAGVGNTLSEKLNSAVSNLDTGKIGEKLSNFFIGALDTGVSFLENTDWQQIGNKIADFFGAIDYSGITSKLLEGIGAALGGSAALIWGLIEGAWGDVVSWWNEVAYEDGQFTISGLLSGIWEKIKDIGSWIKENIFDPFIEGFKSAFGIHSPSTVMKEMGGYLIEGLREGLGGIWEKVKEKFSELWEGISNWFSDKKEKITEKWNTATSGIKDKTANIKAKFSDTVNDVKEKWQKRTKKITDKSGKIKAKFSNTVKDVKDKWQNRTKKITDKSGKIKASFADKIEDVKSKWKDRMSKITDKTATISMTISDGVTNLIKKIVNGIVDILNKAITAVNKVLPSSMQINKIDPPKLATGTVVPKNFGETPVIVGDNKREIEVVSPLSTIKKAVYEVISAAPSSNQGPQRIIFPIYIGNKKITETVIDDINNITTSTGNCPIKI